MRRYVVSLFSIALVICAGCRGAERPYLELAKKTASWLDSCATNMDVGKAWPADPLDPKSVCTDLYYGTAGVVLFYLELYYATGDSSHLEEARAGADYLLANVPATLDARESAGLYIGVSGEAFVLEEVHRASGKKKYRQAALDRLELLRREARTVGSGVEWSETTDIISGSAGIGQFLLYAARTMDRPDAMKLAVQAGRRLLELGVAEHGGLKWRMDPHFPRLMPNFSHGTAGVCYFLASLYSDTGDETFLEGALAGTRYLQDISRKEGQVFHHEPGGENLFYQGWCHGPVGTARLYYTLWKSTGDERWQRAMDASVAQVMSSGIPEKRTPGFWNNVSQCCGSAGVGEFFISLYGLTGSKEHLDFARRLVDDTVARATPVGQGWKWIQAEHRVRPEFLVAQTGYMQGAAGMGIFLLHFDALEQRRDKGIILPDSPF